MKKFGWLAVLVVLSCVVIPARAFAVVNMALYQPVTVNSSYSIYTGSMATDGNYDTYWNAGDHGYSSNPNWLSVDLGAVQNVCRIKLVGGYNPPVTGYPYHNFRNIFNIYSSTNGSTWSLLYSGTLYDDAVGRFDDRSFSPLSARYLKYEEVGGDRLASQEWDIHWSNLAEMEVYGGCVIPEPASLSLLGLGLLGLLRTKRRKNG